MKSIWRSSVKQISWQILAAFISLFVASRVLVFSMMVGWLPGMYFKVHGVHIHHFVYGIAILMATCAFLLYRQPLARSDIYGWAGYAYGIAIALILDELDMWIHLGGTYHSQLSFDAVLLVVCILAGIVLLADLERFGVDTWGEITVASVLLICFFATLYVGIHQYYKTTLEKKLTDVERSATY